MDESTDDEHPGAGLPGLTAGRLPDAAANLDTYKRTRALRDTPLWALAAKDANLKFPAAASTFECAL